MRGEGRRHVMPARLHADGARRYCLVVLVVPAAPNASHPRKPVHLPGDCLPRAAYHDATPAPSTESALTSQSSCGASGGASRCSCGDRQVKA